MPCFVRGRKQFWGNVVAVSVVSCCCCCCCWWRLCPSKPVPAVAAAAAAGPKLPARAVVDSRISLRMNYLNSGMACKWNSFSLRVDVSFCVNSGPGSRFGVSTAYSCRKCVVRPPCKIHQLLIVAVLALLSN